ncbi:MAG: M1 family metallopeptidase [Defluviitaleaceae bacterium]|nr:M1 family metallopeptidase [Defluviitaleaceae bacterium]
MKKMISAGLISMILACMVLGFLVACGRGVPEDYPEPSHTQYEDYIADENDDTPEPLPLYIPGADHYDVSLTVDPATRTVSGISRTTFTNRTGEPLDTIVLRVFLNAFNEGIPSYLPEFEESIFRHGSSYGYMDIQHVTINNEDLLYDLIGTVLLLHPTEPLAPWETVQLVLQYNAYVPMIAHRTGANDRAMWFGMFLPVLAALGEDGWLITEHYLFGDPFVLGMASFEVEVITPADYIVAGTGVTTEEIPMFEADTRVTVFTASNARSFAFAISPYFQRERLTTEGGDIHLYYYSDDLPVDNILEIVRGAMDDLSDRIGQYPFEHIRIIETDMFLGEMSFSNMIFIDTENLRNPDSQALTRVLGQQWFPHIVGSNPVLESWLSRGLVRYIVAGLFHDRIELRAHIAEEYLGLTGRDDLFLTNNLGVFDNWMDYYQTHHIKGMLMFDALYNRMGSELFWELIQQYFQTFIFRIATGADFKDLAEEIYGENLQDFFDEWFIGGIVPPLRYTRESEDIN